MEAAAAELDCKFEATEKKLDNVSWKVEKLVQVETAGDETLSAANLISSVQEIRKEFKIHMWYVCPTGWSQSVLVTQSPCIIQATLNNNGIK